MLEKEILISKLRIAEKALELYAEKERWVNNGTFDMNVFGYIFAEEALKEIKK